VRATIVSLTRDVRDVRDMRDERDRPNEVGNLSVHIAPFAPVSHVLLVSLPELRPQREIDRLALPSE